MFASRMLLAESLSLQIALSGPRDDARREPERLAPVWRNGIRDRGQLAQTNWDRRSITLSKKAEDTRVSIVQAMWQGPNMADHLHQLPAALPRRRDGRLREGCWDRFDHDRRDPADVQIPEHPLLGSKEQRDADTPLVNGMSHR